MIEGRPDHHFDAGHVFLAGETTQLIDHGRALLRTGAVYDVRLAQIGVVETGIKAVVIVTPPIMPSDVHV